MEDTESAAGAASPAEGAAGEPQDIAAKESGASAAVQDGEQRGHSPTGSGKEGASQQEETSHICGEGGTSGIAKTTPSSMGKTEASPDFSFRPPPLIPSLSASVSAPLDAPTYEAPAAGGSEARADASPRVEGPAPIVADEVGKCAFTTSAPSGAPAPVHPPVSPTPWPTYFVHGIYRNAAPGSRTAAREGGFLDSFRLSAFPKSQDEGPQSYSPLSSGRGRDDIIEFVVQRPTSGSAAVPYFLASREGLISPAPSPRPLFREAVFVDREGRAFLPAREAVNAQDYIQVHQPRLKEQQQQQEQLQEKQRNMSASPGVFVLFPPEWETGRSRDFDSSAGDKLPAYVSFSPTPFPPYKAATRAPPCPPEFPPPPYSVRPAQNTEWDASRGVPRFVLNPQNVPVEMRWNVYEQGPPPFPDDNAVAVIQRREPGWPQLFPPATLRRTNIGDKVVVPNAKRLLCFGHAGDERKFCFGLLQLPPPPLKYDFLVEKRAVYCGMCENVNYVAVCRRCRMRLPTCPFCHKQSAIRHP